MPRRLWPTGTKKPVDPKTVRRHGGHVPRARRKGGNQQLRQWPPRRVASWSLMGLGGVVAIQHVIAHAGTRPLPFSMGWQELVAGYPMAMFLVIGGAMLLDPRPRI